MNSNISFKEVFLGGEWVVTEIIKDDYGLVKVKAKRRKPISGGNNFFSELGSEAYINRLCVEVYGKKLIELNIYNVK